jgi:PKD repeat protein
MSSLSKWLWYLSVTLFALILLAFPLTANAQTGITSLPDLNGDGKFDLLWNNPATGQTVTWLMDGTGATGSASLLADPAWKVIKAADLNGDGNTDLIVYNAMTGQTVAWIMNGTTVTGWTLLLTAPDWKVIETADLNGDGKADLIWYNASTGQTAAWLMNGATATSWTVLLTDPNWKVIATADLNGDHMADLLWYNASLNQTAAWLMNGTSTMSWFVLPTAPDWKIVATADFNGDGKADLLWYNSASGQTAMWLMNGASTVSSTTLPIDANWKVSAIADFNGDGKADIVWSSVISGQKIMWLMNGNIVSGSAPLLTSFNWTVAAAADLNNDGKADLLWYNSWTGQTAAWLMNGTTPIGGANLFTDPNWRLKCVKGTSVTSAVACDETAFSAAPGAMQINQPPLVNAGADQTITLPAAANLAGNASDDGAPIALLISTWSQVSGPGTVAFGNASGLKTTAVFSVAGTYTLRLTVNDSAFSVSDDVVVVVGAVGSAPSNRAPVVNAGPDQTTFLSAGVNLLGAASDDGLPNGSTMTVNWSKAGGPGTVTFGNPSSVTTAASFSTAGTYTLRLTATDSLLSSSDDVIIVVNATSSTNQAPIVNAGPDQMITFPLAATLNGSATDDGLPSGVSLTKAWIKVNGPGTVTFGNASSLTTTASFSQTGSYTLRLTVSDSLLSTSDDIVIVVSPAPTNHAPSVNAGNDVSIVFPAGTTLTGNATDDGLPNGSSLTVSWSKVSGPGTVVFVNANSLNASATFTATGTYTLRLTGSDGSLTATDDVIVTVTAPVNLAPVVNAGSDQIVTYPSAAMMAGSATDDGLPSGNTLTRTWIKVSGPGTVTFFNGNLLNATATFSAAGSYTLRLTVSDGALSTSDDVIITVVAPQACGGTATGTLTILANTSADAVGVQIKLDGVNMGPELTVIPYSMPWNTTTTSNGCHTLSAIARDAAGNLGTTSLLVNVSN